MSRVAVGRPPPLVDRPPPLPQRHPVALRTRVLEAWLGLLRIPALDLHLFALAMVPVAVFPVLVGYLFAYGRLAGRIHAGILSVLYLAYVRVPLPPYWWTP